MSTARDCLEQKPGSRPHWGLKKTSQESPNDSGNLTGEPGAQQGAPLLGRLQPAVVKTIWGVSGGLVGEMENLLCMKQII